MFYVIWWPWYNQNTMPVHWKDKRYCGLDLADKWLQLVELWTLSLCIWAGRSSGWSRVPSSFRWSRITGSSRGSWISLWSPWWSWASSYRRSPWWSWASTYRRSWPVWGWGCLSCLSSWRSIPRSVKEWINWWSESVYYNGYYMYILCSLLCNTYPELLLLGERDLLGDLLRDLPPLIFASSVNRNLFPWSSEPSSLSKAASMYLRSVNSTSLKT